jgi:hypothetical protein
MPKVPISENRIQARSVNVEAVKVGALSQDVVGNNVFQAMQGANEVISKIGQSAIDYGVREQEKENQKMILNKANEAIREIDNLAYDSSQDDTGIPKGLLNRKLGQVKDDLTNEYDIGVNDVLMKYGADLDEDSRTKLSANIMAHAKGLRDNVIRHQVKEKDADYENSFQSNLKLQIGSAANAINPEALNEIVDGIGFSIETSLKAKGMDPASIQIAKQEGIDKAIGNNISSKLEVDPATAKAILLDNESKVSPEFFQKTLQTIDGKIFEVKRSGIYNDVFSKMKLSNGEPDLVRIEKAIKSSGQFKSEAEREQMFSYAKAKAMEDNQNRMRYERDNLDRYQNEIIGLKKQGGTLDDALKIVGKYGGDNLDKKEKEDIAKKLFTDPSAKSDPFLLVEFHEKILSGNASNSEIKQAFADNKITASDFVRLSKEYLGNKIGEDRKDMKMAYDAFKNEVNAKFSKNEKEEKADALLVFRQKTEGKTPEEARLIGKQLLESTVIKEGFLWDTKKENFKIEKEKIDANNEAWGKFYQDIGQKEVNAIGGGITRKENRSWGIDDVNKFAQEFGGIDAIKVGTPVNNAIRSLTAKGKMATPANVKAVLAVYKDGNY